MLEAKNVILCPSSGVGSYSLVHSFCSKVTGSLLTVRNYQFNLKGRLDSFSSFELA